MRWDGSASKVACCQAWPPEFNTQAHTTGENGLQNAVILIATCTLCCTSTPCCTSIPNMACGYTHTNKCNAKQKILKSLLVYINPMNVHLKTMAHTYSLLINEFF